MDIEREHRSHHHHKRLKEKKRRDRSQEKKKKKRHSSSSSDSSSSSSSSSDSGNDKSRKEIRKQRKIQRRIEKKQRKEAKKLAKQLKHAKYSSAPDGTRPGCSSTAEDFSVPIDLMNNKARAPESKEEYEARQKILRRVVDPDTGRTRLIRGDGEVIEEIVSRDRHKEINKQATAGDGKNYQARTIGWAIDDL